MPYDINSQQIDIENLFKQNANDLTSIKELYRKLKEMDDKISQIKYIDTQLTKKIQKDYESLKKTILDENIQIQLSTEISKINAEIEKINNEIEKIKPGGITNNNQSFVIVDKNGRGDYTTIQDAINNYDGKPIYVRNGVYEEGRIECADKNITIIGENKFETKIVNYGGLYGDDCIYASNGVFSNLSFISEIKDGVTPNIGSQNGAYAVHVDSNNQAEGSCIFNDCIMVSDFNASLGNGLRKNNTVELNNCDLISRQQGRGQNATTGGMGALFTHNNHTGTGDNCPNQVIRLNNCRLKAKLKYVIKIQEVAKNNAQAILDINNCLLYSESNGVKDVIKYGNVNSFDEMTIWSLSDTSYGNTVNELNKLSVGSNTGGGSTGGGSTGGGSTGGGNVGDKIIYDDSQVTKKGTVGASDLYIADKEFTKCTIDYVTLSCTHHGIGEVRLYERTGNTVTLAKTIPFDSTTYENPESPKIEINYQAAHTYIGFTRSDGSVQFGTKNNFGLLNCHNCKDLESFDITTAEVFDKFSLKIKYETTITEV